MVPDTVFSSRSSPPFQTHNSELKSQNPALASFRHSRLAYHSQSAWTLPSDQTNYVRKQPLVRCGSMTMSELIFVVEEAPEGGFIAIARAWRIHFHRCRYDRRVAWQGS